MAAVNPRSEYEFDMFVTHARSRSAAAAGNAAPPRRPSAPPSPRVASAPNREPREQEFVRPSAQKDYEKPDMDARAKPIRRPGALARVVGGLLCVLLPALAGLLAWRQYGVLRPVVDSLFQIEDTPWLGLTCYIAFAVIAGLAALLPGLWTLLLVRISRERR